MPASALDEVEMRKCLPRR